MTEVEEKFWSDYNILGDAFSDLHKNYMRVLMRKNKAFAQIIYYFVYFTWLKQNMYL